MYSEIFSNFSAPLKACHPYPQACERADYEALPSEIKEKAVKEAEKYLNFSYPSIPITRFMDYSRNGNRVDFETLNFTRRYALNALVVGECVEHKGRFMDDILNGIYCIAEESAWQLPAHNSYIRNTPNFNLPDTTDPVIDLFAAETGALLATVSYLFHSEFDAINPFINKMILDKLKHRIFEPYMNRHFWWMGNGDEPMCNWTVWCTQNVLLSVFLTDACLNVEAPEVAGLCWNEFKLKVLEKASYANDCFLKDYGEDGCCEEGAQYYRHSGLCLFNATEIMNAVTDGFFKSVYDVKKIKNIATYILRVHVHDKYFINFADCSPVAGRSGAREFLLGKAINDSEMMRFAAFDFKASPSILLEKEINTYYHIQNLFTISEMLGFDTDTPVTHPDTYYESVGVFIAHDQKFTLAVKAGDNNDSHNHNDTGSVIVYKNGKPLLIDVGVESYTKKTFSPDRYDIWTMQSAYHNLPTINGVMQHDGPDYKATDVEHFLSKNVSDITMDIAHAYPKEAGVASYKRHACLYKGSQIVIEDHITFAKGDVMDNSYTLNLMFYDEPHISGNILTLPDAKLQLYGDALISCEVIPITDARLKTAWDHDIYRVQIMPRTDSIMLVIS